MMKKIIFLLTICLLPFYFCHASVLASTDFNAMNAFWNSNKIVVAFGRQGAFTYQTSDMKTFTAPFSTAPPSPALTQIQELTLSPAGEYMIRRTLILPLQGFPQGIPAGTTLTVWVQTKFKNGQTTDGIQIITVPNNITYDRIAVDIRGQIRDFNTFIDNYHIRIYKP